MILRRQQTSCFFPQTSARQTPTHLLPSLLRFTYLQLGQPAFHGGRSPCRRGRQRGDSALRPAHSNQMAQTLEKDLQQYISSRKTRRGSQNPLPHRTAPSDIHFPHETNQPTLGEESSKAQRKSSETCCDQDCSVRQWKDKRVQVFS